MASSDRSTFEVVNDDDDGREEQHADHPANEFPWPGAYAPVCGPWFIARIIILTLRQWPRSNSRFSLSGGADVTNYSRSHPYPYLYLGLVFFSSWHEPLFRRGNEIVRNLLDTSQLHAFRIALLEPRAMRCRWRRHHCGCAQ